MIGIIYTLRMRVNLAARSYTDESVFCTLVLYGYERKRLLIMWATGLQVENHRSGPDGRQ